MKKMLTLLLITCLVWVMSTPASAGAVSCWGFFKDVSADDFTTALVDYCNENTIHTTSSYDCAVNDYRVKFWRVVRTNDSLEFSIDCDGFFVVLLPPFSLFIPLPCYFSGNMHVDNPQGDLKKPYTLTITDDDTKFTADGEKWKLQVWNTDRTRFKV